VWHALHRASSWTDEWWNPDCKMETAARSPDNVVNGMFLSVFVCLCVSISVYACLYPSVSVYAVCLHAFVRVSEPRHVRMHLVFMYKYVYMHFIAQCVLLLYMGV